MKKRNLTVITVIASLCLLIFACRKDLNRIVSDQPNVSTDVLESAKVFDAKVLADNASINAKIPGYFALRPLWSNSWTLDVTNNTKFIAVPTIENNITNKEIDIRRMFIFKVENNIVTDGKIVEFVGLKSAIAPQLNNLIKNMQSTNISGFNGAILQYDLNYRRIGGSLYESGAKTADNVIISNSIGGKDLYLTQLSYTGTGKKTFLYTADSKRRIMDDGSASGMGGTLSEVVISGGGGNYGSPGSLFFPDPPNISNGGTSTWGNTDIITTGVHNPCLKAMIDRVVANSIRGRVSKIIQDVFGGADQPDLVFTDQVAMSNPGRAAEEDITWTPQNSTKIQSINIYFNMAPLTTVQQATLVNASEEYLVATILHEAIHAYMDAKGITADAQHSQMIATYVTMMAADIKDMFPTTTDDAANSLAWGGLESTRDMMLLLAPYIGGVIMPNFPVNENSYNIAYHNAVASGVGRRCN